MSQGENTVRLNKVAREFNIGINTIVEFLEKKGVAIKANPNSKISYDEYALLAKEFGNEQVIKEQAKKIVVKKAKPEKEEEEETAVNVEDNLFRPETEQPKVKVVGKIDIVGNKKKTTEKKDTNEHAEVEPQPMITKEATPVIAVEVPQTITPEEQIPLVEETPAPQIAESMQQTDIEVIAPEIEKANIKIVGSIDLSTISGSGKGKSKNRKQASPKSSNDKKNTPPAQTVEMPEAKIEPIAIVKTPTPKPAAPVQVEQEPALPEQPEKKEIEFIGIKSEKLTGPTIVGTIDLKQFESKPKEKPERKGKRTRIKSGAVNIVKEAKEAANKQHEKPHEKKKEKAPKRPFRQEVNTEDVDKQVKETLAKMMEKGVKGKGAKYRKDKRDAFHERMMIESEISAQEASTLQLSEFVTANDLAVMMDLSVNDVIGACLNLGLMVSINQRLDAEAIVLIAESFNYKVEFVTADSQDVINDEVDDEADLVPRPPIITVMGHVDHGKTSLLDSIRETNVIKGEAGGITQHIGAYHVELDGGRVITFLDTPGHEAFTAMRARGAKITDVAIILIAADDSVMPQTIEAINHAVAAGVPMVFAINKIDKDSANPERIKEQLAQMNYLVEDWGGKYQSQEVAAKKSLNIDKLLEKILLEADLLELKANPKRRASGTIVESLLDKGRGYVSRMLVQNGTLQVGDVILSGKYTGRVKAMFNERGQKIKTAGPSMPVEILGLNGAPGAGETFNVMQDEREARDIANKREQIMRMQGLRTQKHITLDEIGRRIAIGNFKELNIIVKGDVDGSVEALTDSLIKLSTEQVQLNVIHKAVGAISESDVQLAAASEAIIIGFQVRPSSNTRKMAEQEQIEIRTYSIIYDAINEIQDAIQGMHAPEFKEEVVCTVEVQQVFRISKVGSVAGCIVREGKITRHTPVRVIRDGIVVYTGELGSLKRFKDDVKEVGVGFECGLNIHNYNDIKEGDIIEGYETVEVKK